MKRRVIAFIDHEIGHQLLGKMISEQPVNGVELVAAVTTLENGRMWWPGVSDLCRQNGIPLHRYCESFNASLTYTDIDWYFLLSWKHIISSELIKHPKYGVINLHYSLLPEYRGVYPVNWAIIEGKKNTGVTYHLVGEEIDLGQIVCQRELCIHLSDTARTLQLRLDDLAFELFDEMLDLAIRGNIRKDAFVSPAETTLPYKSKIDFVKSNELDLNREYRAIDLLNLLRGKSFLPDSRNLYVFDPDTGARIYININLELVE